jgi:small nuclear ribonucleoprotein (snRNP)-like protein
MEMWTENVRGHSGKKVERERSIKKMFLRGDSVILVLLDPK